MMRPKRAFLVLAGAGILCLAVWLGVASLQPQSGSVVFPQDAHSVLAASLGNDARVNTVPDVGPAPPPVIRLARIGSRQLRQLYFPRDVSHTR